MWRKKCASIKLLFLEIEIHRNFIRWLTIFNRVCRAIFHVQMDLWWDNFSFNRFFPEHFAESSDVWRTFEYAATKIICKFIQHSRNLNANKCLCLNAMSSMELGQCSRFRVVLENGKRAISMFLCLKVLNFFPITCWMIGLSHAEHKQRFQREIYHEKCVLKTHKIKLVIEKIQTRSITRWITLHSCC